jgi:zinc D-Ala-D-Ala carboxypeptidase
VRLKYHCLLEALFIGALSGFSLPARAEAPSAACQAGPANSALQNKKSLQSLVWDFYGHAETGWDVVYVHVAHDLKTECPETAPAFAAALAKWQASENLPATGVMTKATLRKFSRKWQSVRKLRSGFGKAYPGCVYGPVADLVELAANDDRTSRQIMLVNRIDPGAYAAYKNLVAAARVKLLPLSASSELLKIFSAHRTPEYNHRLCEMDGRCDGVRRAKCSIHFTGRAVDLIVGGMNGDTSHANRLFQSRSPVYSWLLNNAEKFGFVNYAFEPWHWEYVGDMR